MKQVTVIGGGTGSYTILRGLKLLLDILNSLKLFSEVFEITSVVSMFDSGGDTGQLRSEFGFLPMGDIRRCVLALAPEENREILTDIFNARFDKGTSLSERCLGNLIFLGLAKNPKYGEAKAIEAVSKLFSINGRVLPVTLKNSHLHALLENGETIVGENNIDIRKDHVGTPIKKLYLNPTASIYEEAYKSVSKADLVVVGPGDLYTSVVPNLCVEGMSDALRQSKKVIYVANVMTKRGETDGFTASQMAEKIKEYSGGRKLDAVICNSTPVSAELREKYLLEGAEQTLVDTEEILQFSDQVITEDLLVDGADIVRHDSLKLAQVVKRLI